MTNPEQPQEPLSEEERQKRSTRKGLAMLAGWLILAYFLFGRLDADTSARPTPTPFPKNCSANADTFQERGDAIMSAYIRVHRTGEGDKQELRRQAAALVEPACAPGAKAAMMDWFDAMDAENQRAMHEADDRYLRLLS